MHKKLTKNLTKKVFKTTIITMLIIANFSTIINFAQAANECNSCWTPPAQFHKYESFVKDVLWSIQTIATKWEYTWKPVPPSWFQWEIFKIPEENQFTLNRLAWGIKDRFKKTANTFWATAAILFSIWRELVAKDGIWWFLILFKWQSFVGARKTLLDLDTLIHDKMLELGLAWSFFEKITPTNRKNIQNTINKYVKSEENTDGILETAQLYEWVYYYQIIEMLLRTNSAMKTFIAGNFIKQFENKEFQKKSDETKTKFLLSFNYEQIKLMKEQYQCARRVIWLKNCNNAFKKFWESIKQIWWKHIKWAEKALKTITDANKKLKQSFSVAVKQVAGKELNNDDKKFSEEEKELLMTLYGLDADKMIKDGRFAKINRFRSTVTNGDFSLKSEREQSNMKQKIEQTKENIKDKNEAIKKEFRTEEIARFDQNRNQAVRECLSNYNENKRKRVTKIINIYSKKIDKTIKKSISSCSEVYALVDLIDNKQLTEKSIILIDKDKVEEALENWNPDFEVNQEVKDIYIKSMDTIINHQEDYLKQMTLANNQDLTLFFSEIFKQIHITKEIIGTKDEWLISNLGAACELQCENKEGECYYSNTN